MEKLTAKEIRCFLERSAESIISREGELTDLDMQIGDSDFGVNISRGFRAVRRRLKGDDVGSLLRHAGETIMEESSGTFGTLLGSMLVRMGQSLSGMKSVGLGDLARAFEDGLKLVQELGDARPGQKTMVDALYPFVQALKENRGKGLIEALGVAVEAARKGMESTRDMVATIGRASYYGERSRGHLDPGAYAVYLIVKALYECAQGQT